MDLYFSVIKYRIYPIIPALFLILFPSYYSKNYSSIMCACLIIMFRNQLPIMVFSIFQIICLLDSYLQESSPYIILSLLKVSAL